MAINMENQVLSIEQMNHLKELGVDTSGASVANVYAIVRPRGDVEPGDGYMELVFDEKSSDMRFTLQDIINLMPKHIGDYTLNWYISDMILRYDRIDYFDSFEVLEDLSFSFNEDVTILDVAYDMLCKLAEGGYLNKK